MGDDEGRGQYVERVAAAVIHNTLGRIIVSYVLRTVSRT